MQAFCGWQAGALCAPTCSTSAPAGHLAAPSRQRPASVTGRRALAPHVVCSSKGGASSGADGVSGGASFGGSGGKKAKPGKGNNKARAPGMYEVKVISPPPRSLGVYALPPNTFNGEEIEIDGQGYVVERVVLKYRLQAGKYVRDHNRLEVTPTGRFLLNMYLDSLVHGRYVGPTGPQD